MFMKASPQCIYDAHIDPEALVSWLPPAGMKARLDSYDPHAGGTYRMVLAYDQGDYATLGKTSAHADVMRGRFVELVPHERIVQVVDFESDDPAFAGEMTMTWRFTPASGGTNVEVRAENVPAGIRPEDHEAAFDRRWRTLRRLSKDHVSRDNARRRISVPKERQTRRRATAAEQRTHADAGS
jgi:uncharacterized protein YndB with AHSA1/START domain